MKTPEEIIENTLLLKTHLEYLGVYDNVIQCVKEYASQSKPQLNIDKMVDGIVDSLGETSKGNDYQIHSIRGERWITHKEIGSGEPLKQWLKSEIEKHIEQSKPEEIELNEVKDLLCEVNQLISGWNATEKEWSEWDKQVVEKISVIQSKLVDTKTVDAVDPTFWRRLEMFVSNIQVNDMASEEEKQYIIHVIESKK